MKNFEFPKDLCYNTALIEDPAGYLKESGCSSWLYLVGEAFSKMEGGMSYEQVQAATPHSINVISDPPLELNLELAEQHVQALDVLPRPTLISCRTGPRASAVAYMYAGLKTGATPEEVMAEAEKNNAPFVRFEAYKEWVRNAIETLGSSQQQQGQPDNNVGK